MKTAGASPDVPAVSPHLSGASGNPPIATQKDIQEALGKRGLFFFSWWFGLFL